MSDVFASPGGTPYHLLSAATTNATFVAAGRRSLVDGSVHNTTATVYYVKLFNKGSAPVLGTDTPVLTIPVFPTSSFKIPTGSDGTMFPAGLALAITGGIADNDASVAATGVVVNLIYL